MPNKMKDPIIPIVFSPPDLDEEGLILVFSILKGLLDVDNPHETAWRLLCEVDAYETELKKRRAEL